MKRNTSNIEDIVTEECKVDPRFYHLVNDCKLALKDWLKEIQERNSTYSIVPRRSVVSQYTHAKVFIPITPVTPNQIDLLLEYLKLQYLNKDEPIIGGDYFRIRKCLFKNKYKLSTHSYPYL